jgi:hypothetical protein
MYLPIPIWLVFLLLCIASFAPVVSRWPGWWMAYYGALLLCWVLVSAKATEMGTDAVRHVLTKIRRRIIVAGDEIVIVITDRRRADRRHRLDTYVVERRRAERRRYDIGPLLLTQGWAEVKPLTSEGEEPTS